MSIVNQLETQLGKAKSLVERKEKVKKLFSNKLFKELILEDFCKTEAARLVQNSTDPRLSPEDRADALGSAQAPGYLMRHFSVIDLIGSSAESQISELEEEIEEARNEEQGGELG